MESVEVHVPTQLLSPELMTGLHVTRASAFSGVLGWGGVQKDLGMCI